VISESIWRARRSVGRLMAWTVATLLLLCIAAAGWIGVRAFLAYEHLDQVRTKAGNIAASIGDDPAAAVSNLSQLAADAQAAHELTDDAVWSLAEHAPWVGPQLVAFGELAASTDRLLRLGLLPLVATGQDSPIASLKPVDGRMDLSPLTALQVPAESAAARAAEAAGSIKRIDRTPLVGKLDDALTQAQHLFDKTSGDLDALARATRLLPAMLGGEGPRNYLLVVQNNAEWRSLGGISGTAILLRTDDGAISFEDARSATSISRGLSEPAVALPDELEQIYQSRPARYFQNVTQIPDFTVDGPIAREMYERATGVRVDGVVAVDPVVLSYMLKAVGPIKLADGEELNSANAVSVLLSDVYARYPDPTSQDAFFATAAKEIFGAMLSGHASAPQLLSALSLGSEQRRLLIWAARPDEQEQISGTTLAGELPSTTEEVARFGVYLNDGTGSKMSYYVKPSVSLSWDGCPQRGGAPSRQLTLTLTLTNGAPLDAQTSLPPYVTGNGVYGVAPGSATVVSNVYLPETYELVSASASDGSAYDQGTFEGREVLTFGANLAPQSSASVTVVVGTSSAASGAEAIVTPTADASFNPIVVAACNNASTATLE